MHLAKRFGAVRRVISINLMRQILQSLTMTKKSIYPSRARSGHRVRTTITKKLYAPDSMPFDTWLAPDRRVVDTAVFWLNALW